MKLTDVLSKERKRADRAHNAVWYTWHKRVCFIARTNGVRGCAVGT